ncbi:hypothetical protein LSAT2_026480 [Lamellibrachia satsuma]|nr:hypothetical protein LSAT2_026480 [Lamellibrachia satsuma]
MKSFTALLAIVTMTLLLGNVAVDGTDWFGLASCVGSKLAAVNVECGNCDDYFQCQGKHNAITLCHGAGARRAATAFIECQTGTDSPGGAADKGGNANRRTGENCYALYGCANNCNYKPSDEWCIPSNC